MFQLSMHVASCDVASICAVRNLVASWVYMVCLDTSKQSTVICWLKDMLCIFIFLLKTRSTENKACLQCQLPPIFVYAE